MSQTLSTDENGYKRWGLTGTLLWSLSVAFLYFVAQTIVALVYIGLHQTNATPANIEAMAADLEKNGNVIVYCTLTSFILCSGLLLLAAAIKRGSRLSHYFGFKYFQRSELKVWGGILIAYLIFSDGMLTLLGIEIVPEFMSSIYTTSDNKILFWIALVVAAPVLEEMFFRGFLFEGIANSFAGPIAAIVLTSVLWSAIHVQYDGVGIAIIFIMGLILGVAKHRTGSLYLTMGMHAFGNAIATVETVIKVSQ